MENQSLTNTEKHGFLDCMENEHQPNIPILKTHVYFQNRVFFVSTIERTYDTYAGSSRGNETMAWEVDPKTLARGAWLYQGGGPNDHFDVCRQLVLSGEIKEKDE
jgi:hypothetical protein